MRADLKRLRRNTDSGRVISSSRRVAQDRTPPASTRILVVDDEPAIVLAVKDEMSFEGFDVASAADGPAGLRLAREWRPDVLLLDLMLPGVNGFEICRQLRADLPELWIILLTARGNEADRVTGFEAGADDYMVKPFSLRELVGRVKVGLRRRRIHSGAGRAPGPSMLGPDNN